MGIVTLHTVITIHPLINLVHCMHYRQRAKSRNNLEMLSIWPGIKPELSWKWEKLEVITYWRFGLVGWAVHQPGNETLQWPVSYRSRSTWTDCAQSQSEHFFHHLSLCLNASQHIVYLVVRTWLPSNKNSNNLNTLCSSLIYNFISKPKNRF